MLPVFLVISAMFQGPWRTPVVVFLAAFCVAQIAFMVTESFLAIGYGFGRRIGWVLLWPFWQYCLVMFSTESLLSLPGRPLPLLTRKRRRHRRGGRPLTGAHPRLTALVCAVALTTGCAGGGARRGTNKMDRNHRARPSAPLPSGGGLKPPPVPEYGAYLGAWFNPTGPERERPWRLANLPRNQVVAMRATVGNLGMLHVYVRWNAPAPVAALQDITAASAVPVLSWGCGPDRSIIEGREDELIRSYAESLRSFGRPVFLRYAWEMNLREAGVRTASPLTDRPASSPPGDMCARSSAMRAHRTWRSSRCPGIARPDTWRSYYPGVDAVDWIGVDGYVLDPDPAAAAEAFPRLFAAFYAQFVNERKPFMVGETGARPGAQAEYLSSIAALLPAAYPR